MVGAGAREGKGAVAEVGLLPVLRALVGAVAGVARGSGALALGTWAAVLRGSSGVAAAVWAYIREAAAVAAVAADAMLIAEEETCWADRKSVV